MHRDVPPAPHLFTSTESPAYRMGLQVLSRSTPTLCADTIATAYPSRRRYSEASAAANSKSTPIVTLVHSTANVPLNLFGFGYRTITRVRYGWPLSRTVAVVNVLASAPVYRLARPSA